MPPKSVFVLSGKGGTGKTFFCLNVAFRLKDRGHRVGVIDADIDSPNVAEFLGMEESIKLVDVSGKRYFKPVAVKGLQVFTMASICGKMPVSMRGEEYGKILQDVVQRSLWEAEYFVIDMPAGASDELKVAAEILTEGLLGSIIVMQPAHALDAERMLELHRREGIPVLALIENMASFSCECGKTYEIFGPSRVKQLAEIYGIDAFGSVPLSMIIREAYKKREPYVTGDLMAPIDSITEKILATEPQGRALVERLREAGKEIARKVLIDIVGRAVSIINEEIDIVSYQREYGFTGGRIIQLDVCNKSLRGVKAKWYFTIRDGKLYVVKHPRKVDVEIRVWDKALIWATLGERKIGEQVEPYDWLSAWLLGHAEIYGSGGETQDALYWMREVWLDLGEAIKERHSRLYGLLKRLA